MSTTHLWWYLARSSGLVLLVCVTATILWGLLLSTRLIRRRSLPRWLLDLHRFLGSLTLALLMLHVGALVADSNVSFDLDGFSQQAYAQKMIDEYKQAGVPPVDVYPQSFDLADVMVPGASAWRTGAVAWGIVGGWLIVAIQVTSWLRRRLSRSVWRWVHWSSVVVYVASIVHAIQSGSDVNNRIYVSVAVVSGLAVVFVALVRVVEGMAKRAAPST